MKKIIHEPASKICDGCNAYILPRKGEGRRDWAARKYCNKMCSITTRVGEKAAHWSGDKVGYHGVHAYMKNTYGKASKCVNLACPKKSTNYQWANLSGKYLRDRSDWAEMCASCHQLMDRKNVCKRGHELTPENSYVHPKRGRRTCRTCAKMRTKLYQQGRRVTSLPL